jgi:hypothetical protein
MNRVAIIRVDLAQLSPDFLQAQISLPPEVAPPTGGIEPEHIRYEAPR